MTTERASKERHAQKPEKPKQAFSAEAGQELEAPQPSLDLTPQNILYLQRTVGNAAVQRLMLKHNTHSADERILKRSPKDKKKEPDINEQDAIDVLYVAVYNLSHNSNIENSPLMLDHVSSRYRQLIWDWALCAKALKDDLNDFTTDVTMKRGGLTLNFNPGFLNQVMDETKPFRELLASKDPPDPLYQDLVNQYDTWSSPLLGIALELEANKKVSQAGERYGTIITPEAAIQKAEAKEVLKVAIETIIQLGELNDTLFESQKIQVYKEFVKLKAEGNVPEQINLEGKNTNEIIKQLRTIAEGYLAIIELKDPEAALKQYKEKYGDLGTVLQLTDVMSNGLKLGKAVIAGIGLVAAGTCTVLGKPHLTEGILSAFGSVGKPLGAMIGALGFIKGAIMVSNPNASVKEQFEGATNVMLGGSAVLDGVAAAMGFVGVEGGIVLGDVSAVMSGVGTGLLLGISYVELQIEMAKQVMSIPASLGAAELFECYKQMDHFSKNITSYSNKIIQGQKLLNAEKDSTKKKYLQEAVNKSVSGLREDLIELLTGTGIDRPGHYDVLKRRFAVVGPPPTENTSVTDLLMQAQKVLKVIEKAILNSKLIIEKYGMELWEKYG